jgi:hypothetical protein
VKLVALALMACSLAPRSARGWERVPTIGAGQHDVERVYRFPFAVGVSTGATCIQVDRSGCMFALRVGLDLIVGDLHLGILVPARNDLYGGSSESGTHVIPGLQVGTELGTPYFEVVRFQRARGAVALRVAGRASIDANVLSAFGDALNQFALTNTYGPDFSLRIGKHLSVTARVAAGFGLHLSEISTYHLALDAYAGAQYLF